MDSKIKELVNSIKQVTTYKDINIMEVCGTHTMAISKSGLRQLLPANINLISGPGCPVCVTSIKDIDCMLEIINKYDVCVFTFGDMLRVPGSNSSLYTEKSKGKSIRICYSPTDALEFAKNNPEKNVIFVAIGFETTIPLIAVTAKRAYEENINNFYIYNTHKLIPPALDLLLSDKKVKIDGLLCPGHVSVIIGSKPYEFIPKKYNVPCVISGFEPVDILTSVKMILKQIKENHSEVQIQYSRAVRKEGNPTAVSQTYDVFEKTASEWRGLGCMPESGLKLKSEYLKFDAAKNFPVGKVYSKEHPGCECGDILKGIKKPYECKLFSKACTPGSPVGPCMVSNEGTCAAYYKYEKFNLNRKTKISGKKGE
jgi:hydrogenase expression/formation protein HypD